MTSARMAPANPACPPEIITVRSVNLLVRRPRDIAPSAFSLDKMITSNLLLLSLIVRRPGSAVALGPARTNGTLGQHSNKMCPVFAVAVNVGTEDRGVDANAGRFGAEIGIQRRFQVTATED